MLGLAADPRPLAIAGHSRGGKVSWLLALREQVPLRVLVGVDPVDGRGSVLFSAQPEALPSADTSAPPSVIVGMRKGGSCAPEGDNYRHFFERTAPPTTLIVLQGSGHGDMLDDGVDFGGLCFEGPERASARALVAGVMVAALRRHLQDDPSVDAFLASPALAPLEVTHEGR